MTGEQDPIKVIMNYCQKVIRKQRRTIKKIGYDPTWALFESTFGWHQIKKKMSPTMREIYKNLWIAEDLKEMGRNKH